MVTLVGTQSRFEDAIYSLIELEYDAVGAYQLAIDKLENIEYKEKLASFLNDHNQHITSLTNYYSKSAIKLPTSPDYTKGMMAKMKVMLGDLTGSDRNILKAMLSNELDTNSAYERIVNHSAKPDDLSEILDKAFIDEQAHKIWLDKTIG